MTPHPRLVLTLLALGLAISTASAQSPASKSRKKPKAPPVAPIVADSQPAPESVVAPAPVETAAAPAPAPAQPADSSASATAAEQRKKHHGLFGKVKDAASNKVVQSVAKTAACTMVPGGAGAAGAAAGAGCYSGMGMGNAAAQAAQQQAMAQQQQAMMAQQQQMKMMQQQAALAGVPVMDDQQSAACLGVSVEEYHLIVDPPPYPESKAHMKARANAGKKLDQSKQAACGMQAGNQMMGQVQNVMGATEQKIAESRAAGITEAPGATIELASDPSSELRKGKTAVRHIDWVAGSGDISAAGQASFQDAMARLAAALRETGGQYRIDLYMDPRYDETAVSMFGPTRLALVEGTLTSAGVSPAVVVMGKAKRDKDPRLEIVKGK
jgi:hypothetical protein